MISVAFLRNFSLLPLIGVLLVSSGCSLRKFPSQRSGCKMRTHINVGLQDYLSSRFHSPKVPRVGILPFLVQETFASSARPDLHQGRMFAQMVKLELVSQADDLGVIEFFDVDIGPDKKEDFERGNYIAIETARRAGYDLVVIGKMAEIRNEHDIEVTIRIIDTANNVTLWHSKNILYSQEREWRRSLANFAVFGVDDRPDLFDLPARTAELAKCSVRRILREDLVSVGGTRKPRGY